MSESIKAIRTLQTEIGAGNRANGWREQSDRLAGPAYDGTPEAQSALDNYAVTKAALITTEVAELIEEIRNGRAIDETYYPTAAGATRYENDGKIFKPEGVPSELADIVIRALDFADEFDIDLADAIAEKLAYNATRGIRHGGKGF